MPKISALVMKAQFSPPITASFTLQEGGEFFA